MLRSRRHLRNERRGNFAYRSFELIEGFSIDNAIIATSKLRRSPAVSGPMLKVESPLESRDNDGIALGEGQLIRRTV
jgi:hypothetical protein